MASTLPAEVRVVTADAMKAATSKVQPQYPTVARQMKIAGHVEIEAVIGPRRVRCQREGYQRQSDADPAGDRGGGEVAFTPFTDNGEATKAVVTLGFDFRP